MKSACLNQKQNCEEGAEGSHAEAQKGEEGADGSHAEKGAE